MDAMRSISSPVLAKEFQLAFGGGLELSDIGGQLVQAEQFAGGEKVFTDRGPASFVRRTDNRLTVPVASVISFNVAGFYAKMDWPILLLVRAFHQEGAVEGPGQKTILKNHA